VFTLYTTPLSANGRKALAVSRHLGLAPEIRLVDVYRGEGRTPEYLSINPWGKIPTLVDGDLTLWESNAIVAYLAEAYGDYRLWSRHPKQRADIARWLFWESSHWQPTLIPFFAAAVGRALFPERALPQAAAVHWEDPALQTLLQFLERHLSERRFLVGDQLTLADFCVGAMLMYGRVAGFPFERFTALAAWYARIEALAAWKATAVGPWAY